MGQNREAWLMDATRELAGIIAVHGVTVPDVRVSVGFPKGGTRGNHKAIGQCWSGACATDGVPQVFIHPELVESARVLDVLLHEVIHAAVGTKHGHRGEFARVAKAAGLEGKMTATVAGHALRTRLLEMVERLGEYPHAALDASKAGRKQSTRMLKCECAECGYTVRTTAKWLDTMGGPLCPCSGLEMRRV